MYRKLDIFDLEELYKEGVEIVEDLELDTSEFHKADLNEVSFHLGKDSFMLDYASIKGVVDLVPQSFLDGIDFIRLDWCWDFTWTYHLWETDKFSADSLRLYALIRGGVPSEVKNTPFQIVLNAERKRRIKIWEKLVVKAMRKENNEMLRELLNEPESRNRLKAKDIELAY